MKLMKKILAAVLAASMLVSGMTVCANAVSASPAASISVKVDNSTVAFPDQKPTVQNNRTLVPIRFIAEALGYKVEWNSKDNTAVIDNGRIKLYIGTDQAVIDGKKTKLDTKSVVMNERTMVPLRVVAETLGCTVDWAAETQTVLVNRRNRDGTEKSLFERYLQTGLFWNFKSAENEYLVPKKDFRTVNEAKDADYWKMWIERPLDRTNLANPAFDCSLCMTAFTKTDFSQAKNLLEIAYPSGYNTAYSILDKTVRGELWETFYDESSEWYPLYSMLPPQSGTFGTRYSDNREIEMYMNSTGTQLTVNFNAEGYSNPETPRKLTADEIRFYTAEAKRNYCLELWGLK